jgi:hypothetical protein
LKKKLRFGLDLIAMLIQQKNCGGCKKRISVKKNYNLLTVVLLTILPKCPFCVMAYSSTLMLCNKDTLIEKSINHSSSLSIYITAFFCLVAILGLLLNYKDNRTKYAISIASLGSALIMYSIIKSGGQELYYFGVSIIFFAIWFNGSFLSILRKIKFPYNIFMKPVVRKS